ncbi:MAG: hypothetical protein KAU20_04075 [Nanoarchaeota archaeon]|nr:hypothetical protein [Nanoarchaeota archaeon]
MAYPETTEYIKKQLKEGFSPERIKKALLDAGYLPEVVDSLMKEAGVKEDTKKSTSGIEKVLLKDIAIGVILLLVVGGFVYFSFFKPENLEEKEMLAPAEHTSEQVVEEEPKSFFKKEIEGNDIGVDFSHISPLKLRKGSSIIIDLTNYIKNAEKDDKLRWVRSGHRCIEVIIRDSKATLKHNDIASCPSTENIKFQVIDTNKRTDSDILVVKVY